MSTRHEEAVLVELRHLSEIAKKHLVENYRMFKFEAESLINKTLIAFSVLRGAALEKQKQ